MLLVEESVQELAFKNPEILEGCVLVRSFSENFLPNHSKQKQNEKQTIQIFTYLFWISNFGFQTLEVVSHKSRYGDIASYLTAVRTEELSSCV